MKRAAIPFPACKAGTRIRPWNVRRGIQFIVSGSVWSRPYRAARNSMTLVPRPSAWAITSRAFSPCQGAKGSVQFPKDKPVPFGLIGKIVKFRVREILKKAR